MQKFSEQVVSKMEPVIQKVTPECEILFEDSGVSLQKLYNDCEKNPGHPCFIPVPKLKADYLPPDYRTPEMMNEIFKRCLLTVFVRVPYTSAERPDQKGENSVEPYPYAEHKGKEGVIRHGTGSIAEVFYYQPVIGKHCPCPECKQTGLPKNVFWWVCVRTATHVIYDSSEAKRAEFHCFFDSDDKKGVKKLYGMDVFNIMPTSKDSYHNDACYLWAITHDHETVAILNKMEPSKKFIIDRKSSKNCDPSKIIVAHPHGCSKTVTVGNILHLTVPIDVGENKYFEKTKEFSEHTVYRKIPGSGQSGFVKERIPFDKDSKDTEFYDNSMKKLLQELKSSDEYKSYEQLLSLAEKANFPVSTNDGQTSCQTTRPIENISDEYMREFYFSFIRHSCLMHLFVSTVEHKRKEGFGANSTKEAMKHIFTEFLGTKYSPKSEMNNEPEQETKETVYRHWVIMLKESGNQMFKKILKKETVSSKFLEIFQAVRGEIDAISLDLIKNDKHKAQETVIDLLYQTKSNCLEFVPKIKSENPDRALDTVTKDGAGSPADEKDGAEKREKQVGDEREKEEEEEGSELLPGATYTLPDNSEFEYRFYSERPGWITFPPGTQIRFNDGTYLERADLYEFKDPGLTPHRGYLTYDIHTCKGCSGAGVKFDTTGHFARTFFPHSGHENAIKYNRSGTQRESGKLTYPHIVLN